MNQRLAVLFIVISSVACVFSSARCQIRGNALQESDLSLALDSLFTHGHFEELEFHALRVLHGKVEVTVEDELAASLYLGYVNVLSGEEEQARLDFTKALQLDPNLKLDPVFTPPRIYQTFQATKSEFLEPRLNKNESPHSQSYAPLLNLAIPGTGFIMEEEYLRGFGWFTLETITLSSFIYSLNERKSARRNYLTLPQDSDFDNYYDTYNKWHKRSLIWGVSSAIIYIAAQSDYFLNSKRFSVNPVYIEDSTTGSLGFGVTLRF
ncbi:hypothetical protein K8I28_10220 [bacterium]|nr:hypothetical protein [bacterium]